jgi:hypothetical protein
VDVLVPGGFRGPLNGFLHTWHERERSALRRFLGPVRDNEERSPQGFSPPRCPAASYVQRPPTTARTRETASASQAASSPVGSPFDSLSYAQGPPNTQ